MLTNHLDFVDFANFTANATFRGTAEEDGSNGDTTRDA